MRAAPVAVLLSIVVLAAGCKLGPKNLAPDRFSYTSAVARSNHEQLLSNIVRLRYNEPPVFLGIGSVLTQYVYSGRIGVSGAASGDATAIPGWTVGGSASGIYIERPTITYAPLVGQEFAHQLLAPIDPEAVFALVQQGWSPAELLKLTIESINHVDGRLRRPIPTPDELEGTREFLAVIDLLIEVASRDALEMHRNHYDPTIRSLVFAETADLETAALIAELKAALGLDPNRSSFRVTDRDLRAPDEITIRSRSFGAMLGLEARGVQVPVGHIEANRAMPTTMPDDSPDIAAMIGLRIRSQPERPDDAFVAIKHQGYWFFIANDDHATKQTFGLLGYLFQIQAPAAPSVGGPVLTVPTG